MFPKSKLTDDLFTFAFLSDCNGVDTTAKAVIEVLKTYNPDYIAFGGDYNYSDGTQAGYWTQTILKYFGPEVAQGKMHLALGNHDIDGTGLALHCMNLRQGGNGRYFKIEKGPVNFYYLDYGCNSAGVLIEPDGNDANSIQANWLYDELAKSTARFNVGIIHRCFLGDTTAHPDYPILNWPYRQKGLHLLLSGHNHVYQEFNYKGFPMIVAGLGGSFTYTFDASESIYSRYRFTGKNGFLLGTVDKFNLELKLVLIDGTIQRTFTLNA